MSSCSVSESRSQSLTAGGSAGQERAAGNGDDERLCKPVHDRLGPVKGSAGHNDQGASPSFDVVVGCAHRHPGVELLGSHAAPSTLVSNKEGGASIAQPKA
jgi:hypothetical protein